MGFFVFIVLSLLLPLFAVRRVLIFNQLKNKGFYLWHHNCFILSILINNIFP
ncbi:uncharacterized protein MP3633_0751 [Marinomonas primoryensis]|uniref:Uncharacterized protein n=1 Tax=Marinomonas primoryensis TaxID=178399 RepID=A0A859CTP3_9GAMM|nr:uncharacterized protein MP3633_0751 [Marinomonas primoryensis]